LHGRTHRLKKV